MTALKTLIADENGSALIEYTVLTAIMSIVVIGAVLAIGNWAGGKWTALQAQLS